MDDRNYLEEYFLGLIPYDAAMNGFCEQFGYQVVLDKSSTNNLIFASPKIDISDELLEKLGYSK
jgi:Skp family chaperone for outer membrane proteins